MAAPRVFVSHSTHDDVSRALLDGALEAVRASGCEPVADRELLVVGDAWSRRLVEAVRGAQAVVLLASPDALTSTWVLREMSLAADARVDARGNTRLFVLRLPGVEPGDLAASSLGHLGLDTLQCPAVADARDVAAHLGPALAPIRRSYADRPDEEVEALVEGVLLRLTPHQVQLAAASAGVDHRSDEPPTAVCARLARRLIECDGAPVDGARRLQHVLEQLHGLDWAGVAPRFVDVTLAYGVLPDGVRTQMNAVLDGRGGTVGAAAALSAGRSDTAMLYVRRASTRTTPWSTTVCRAVEADDQLAELVANVRVRLLDALGYVDDDDPGEDELRAELESFERACGPIVVVVPASPDRELVRAMLRRFPLVLFVFLSGPMAPSDDDALRWIEPHLPPDEEAELLRIRRQILGRLGVGGRESPR